MGNAGSVHNLQNGGVDSELSSYCTQQHLRRTTRNTKKKGNQVALGGWSSGRNMADCKVLPRPTENPKLRATTNGAILQAGGTISFRAKEPSDWKKSTNETAIFYPMRRCHTLILDGHNDMEVQRISLTPQKEFRRSQTLLHVAYSSTKAKNNKQFNDSVQPLPPPTTSATSTLKVNRYNKKRKAPPAPIKISSSLDKNISGQGQILSTETKNNSLTKPRIYTTNSNRTSMTPKQQLQQIHKLQSQSNKTDPFQRNSITRESANSSRLIQPCNSSPFSKLQYRREKSFDDVLLRQKEVNICSENIRIPTQKPNIGEPREHPNPLVIKKFEKKDHDGNRKKNLVPRHYDVTRDSQKLVEPCRQEEFTKKNQTSLYESEYQNMTRERKAKWQQSRIPQLKRTFYFGMESSRKSPVLSYSEHKPIQSRNEKAADERGDTLVLNHNIEADEEIIDNGILVHVRPTLPRRQPETPSFSPTAAWRNLLEEQLRSQKDRSKRKDNIIDSRAIESPICPTTDLQESSPPIVANWTPQQDLEDDDDDEDDDREQKFKTTKLAGKAEMDTEIRSNSLHIFSLSLPRDVHLQCQMKPSLDFAEQDSSFKMTSGWLVPGFNSLQKFKNQLGKNTDFRSNLKCKYAANTASNTKRNSSHLQNIFGDSFAADSKSNHQPVCELNKLLPRPPCYHNDNWLLHKSNSNNAPLVASTKTDENCLNSTLNSISIVTLQPKSLTNICGGKHIVYLPGQNTFSASGKSSYKNPKQTKKTTRYTYKRQCQRESLQDLTPIENIHQSNTTVPEKNTHRFSFQSTVRVLEKRRLAEKLSKDAEIQEAQRLNELEAMKRVEEDFQRKRAPEKANLRNQLRLHLKATNTENEEYKSLPLNINETYNNTSQQNQHMADHNNNLFCRAEPDGAVSPSLDIQDDLYKSKHSNFPLTSTKSLKDLKRFEFDLDGSDNVTEVPNLQRTTFLMEPSLHSII